jgi:hypothetical protein
MSVLQNHSILHNGLHIRKNPDGNEKIPGDFFALHGFNHDLVLVDHDSRRRRC